MAQSNSCLSSTINSHPTGNVLKSSSQSPLIAVQGTNHRTHPISRQWVDGGGHPNTLRYPPNDIKETSFQ